MRPESCGTTTTVAPCRAELLCVDDDQHFGPLLRHALEREGFGVRMVRTAAEALQAVRDQRPDLILLDVNLPDQNGFEVLSALRTFSRAPVIVLTARAGDEDTMTGLARGADDYVTKPFSVPVLVHRIKAVLRRARARTDATATPGRLYRIHGALFNPETHEIVGHNMRIHLTRTENRILHLLFLHEGHVFSVERLRALCGTNSADYRATVVKTHIRHLRQKIGRLPHGPRPICTLRGAGYVVWQTDEHGRKLATRRASDTR